jgi:Reverse transcriptase (RNA-dependent DNA polymerase)
VIAVPRTRGRIRWLTELSSEDARAYDEAVAPLVAGIEASLGRAALANRVVHPGRGTGLRLADWRVARRPWIRGIVAAARAPATLIADVADCYASMRPATVESALRCLGADHAAARRVRRWLDGIQERGVSGLPIGPDASAILANATLASVDTALTAVGATHLRWVDDFLIPGSSLGQVGRARDALLGSLDRLGLAPNPEKTAILRDAGELGARLGSTPSGPPGPGWAVPHPERYRVR